jgi:hypothetical protein
MCNPIVNLGLTVHPTFLSLDLITVTVKEDSASQKPVIHQECNVLFVGIFSTFFFSNEKEKKGMLISHRFLLLL